MNLTGRHESSDLSLPQLFLLAIYWLWRKADSSFIELPRDQDCLPPKQEVVAVDIVGPSESRGRDTVSEGEGGDAIMFVVEEVEGIVGWFLSFGQCGLLVIDGSLAC